MSADPSAVPTPPATVPTRSKPNRAFRIVLFAALAAVTGVTVWLYASPPTVPLEVSYRGQIGTVERAQGDSLKFADGLNDADGDLLADTPTAPLAPEVLVMAGPSGVDPAATKAEFEPLRIHLEKTLGMKVEYFPAAYTQEVIDALYEKKLHVAYFPTGAVPRAVNRGGFVPVCSPANAEGAATYTPLVIVPTNGPVATLADVRGRSLACVSVTSHSGYKAPLLTLREQHQLRPGTDYELRWTASHGASIRGIAAGLYPAAGVASDELEKARARGIIREDQYRVIETGRPQPMDALGMSYTLRPDLAAKVRAALISFGEVSQLYPGTAYVKFVPVDYKRDWAEIRKADEEMARWNDTAGK